MSFKIVVDSCCEMTRQMQEDPTFIRVPLTIACGENTFVDDDSFDQADLLWAMKQTKDAPATACPSPQAYLDAFSGEEEDVYAVTLSALLSGSHNSAQQGKQLLEEDKPEKNIHVFNSCSAVCGESLIALKIKELAEQGLPFKKVVREVEQFIRRMKTLFVLEDLENLRKNGRLTKMQAVVTGALRIKLFCHATPEGEIGKLGQALTVKQALGKLVDRIADDLDHVGRTLIISHCNCLERAVKLKEQIEARCRFDRIFMTGAGGITTVYANDGGIVVAY
ncbi:MAG: DegV family protein [Oscillospiraceae bacterium]|nr:DegV family protein [Oscillospiraceae bacterium]